MRPLGHYSTREQWDDSFEMSRSVRYTPLFCGARFSRMIVRQYYRLAQFYRSDALSISSYTGAIWFRAPSEDGIGSDPITGIIISYCILCLCDIAQVCTVQLVQGRSRQLSAARATFVHPNI